MPDEKQPCVRCSKPSTGRRTAFAGWTPEVWRDPDTGQEYSHRAHYREVAVCFDCRWMDCDQFEADIGCPPRS